MGIKHPDEARALPEFVGRTRQAFDLRTRRPLNVPLVPDETTYPVEPDDVVCFTDEDGRVMRVARVQDGFYKVHDPALEAICRFW